MEDVLTVVPRQKADRLSNLAYKLKRAVRGDAAIEIKNTEDWNPELVIAKGDTEDRITCWERSSGWSYFVARSTGTKDVHYCIVHDEKTLCQRVANPSLVGYKKYAHRAA